MDNQIPEDPYRILARERSHEDARQTVATNRMLVQSLYVRRTTQEWSSFWELKSYPDMAEREKVMEGHRKQAIRSKRWSTGLLVFSEVFFLAASLSLAMSLG
jgi:hypothetical protein